MPSPDCSAAPRRTVLGVPRRRASSRRPPAGRPLCDCSSGVDNETPYETVARPGGRQPRHAVELIGRTIPYLGRGTGPGDGHPRYPRAPRHRGAARPAGLLRHRSPGCRTGQLFLDRVDARHGLGPRPARRHRSRILLLDLDRFKVINESLGHAAGDQLLVAVARRLADVAAGPADTLARLGGDEFAVLVDGIVAERCRGHGREAACSKRWPRRSSLEGREAYVGASVGVALGRPGSSSATDLLREADVALYRAKGDPTVRHAVFHAGDERLPAGAPRPGAATSGRAVERHELRRPLPAAHRPAFRPDGRPRGAGALAAPQPRARRCRYSFIPLAEETGLIVPIGEWVLRRRAARRGDGSWTIPGVPDLIVSVNLSARQLARPDLAAHVAATLAGDRPRSGLPGAGDHRERRDARGGGRGRNAPRASTNSGSAWSSTTSGRATRPSPTCRSSRSTSSRSTGRSSPGSRRIRRTCRSSGPSPPSPTASASTVTAEGIEREEQLASRPRARLRPRPGLPVRPAAARRGCRPLAPGRRSRAAEAAEPAA